MAQTVEEMVSAGFFYLRSSDVTACYQCGLQIRGLEAHDVAWPEHRRMIKLGNTRCEYMDLIKGSYFYDEEEDVTATSTSATQETKTENKEEQVIIVDKDNHETTQNCVVCFNNNIAILFLPCLHVASCETCASQLSKCAVCRHEITGYMHVYLP
jgi:baculoviral IAP repeat-containing protein 7/8